MKTSLLASQTLAIQDNLKSDLPATRKPHLSLTISKPLKTLQNLNFKPPNIMKCTGGGGITVSLKHTILKIVLVLARAYFFSFHLFTLACLHAMHTTPFPHHGRSAQHLFVAYAWFTLRLSVYVVGVIVTVGHGRPWSLWRRRHPHPWHQTRISGL